MLPSSDFGRCALGGLNVCILKAAQAMPVSWLGRRLALILRKLVLLQKMDIVDATVDGLKLRLHLKDNVSERKFLFMPQFFDTEERKLLKTMLRPHDVFIDIGANAGIYSLTAAARGAKVLAIEPNPAVLERLSFNAALNGFDVTTEQAAVSDSAGTFDLTLDRTNLGGASLVEARSREKISVRCDTLLDILKKHWISRVTALKIDIEGAEDKALIPFFGAAPSSLHPAIIILENAKSGWRQDLPGALEKAGYALEQTTRMNMIWRKAS